MSKTAWACSTIILSILFTWFYGTMILTNFINQKPTINTFTIDKLEFTSETGNFTMTNVKLEIPSRSLDWLPLAGITLKQNTY